MRRYNYKARTETGKQVAGIVEANSNKHALALLHEKGLVVLYLKEKSQELSFSLSEILGRVSGKDVVEFTRQLATMISAGLTLTEALAILEHQGKPATSSLLSDVRKKVEGGTSFHQALLSHKEVFSSVYLSLVKSGEAAGKLDMVLEELADLLERQMAFRRKVKGAFIYPTIVVVAMIGVASVMMVFVIPKLTSVYQEMDIPLPLTTKLLIGLSNFMASFWFLIFGGLGLAIYSFLKWRKTPEGKKTIDPLLLKIPVIGNLLTKIMLTQVVRTLAMLIKSGVSIIESLKIVSKTTGNYIYEQSIKKASKDVERGMTITESLENSGQYPPILTQMISVGEQTGKLDEVLNKVADYFEQESEAALKTLVTAIEPIMIIVLAVGVGFVVISIIMPIYNITAQF